jgi:mannosyl-oligosaccharide glucosidase
MLIVEESKLVCHKGYISIFPLLLGLIPVESPHLGALLDMMSDPMHLWSDYGLRSLSKSDPFYSTGENYWRGPIWINMNYLALSSLHKVHPLHGPLATKPRTLLIEELHLGQRTTSGKSESSI